MILDILTILFLVGGFVLLFRLIKKGRRDRETANLALRSIGSNEYAVIEDGNLVGRIMLTGEPPSEIWLWNCNLPGAGVSSGTAASLREAQIEFRLEWNKRKSGYRRVREIRPVTFQ